MAEQLPIWQDLGVEPPALLKTNGWQPGMKPSAQHMNWLFNRIYKCLEEIQAGGGTEELEQELETLQQELVMHMADNTGHVYYADDIGTANAKVVVLNPAPEVYKKGFGISFTNLVQNTGAVTININGLGAKPILKSNGNPLTSGSLKVESIYTLRYNGTSFILQGEGGSGNALASDLLSGKTATTDVGDIVGTIPSKATGTITPGTTNQAIAAGQYLSGIQTILGDPDLIAANIIAGKNIFNVAGTATPESLGGVIMATGTTSSFTTHPYMSQNNYSGNSALHVTVTGLTFLPSIIVLFGHSTTYGGGYAGHTSLITRAWGYKDHLGRQMVGGVAGSGGALFGWNGFSYVNDTGFKIPFTESGGGGPVTWIAIK